MVFKHVRDQWASIGVVLLLGGICFLYTFRLFLSGGMPHTHDGELHIARTAAYFQALKEGQFPVRWASELNYGYGTPVFNFYYPLPYMAGSVLHWIGLRFADAYKVLLITAFILSPVSFYAYMQSVFPRKISFIASLFYGLAPYHFLDLFVRGAIGELFAFVCIPFVLWATELLKKQKFSLGFFIGTVSYSCLILSHNAFGLLFSFVFGLYALFSLRSRKEWIVWIAFILMGLSITAYFWIPAMVEQRYTHADVFITDTYKQSFVSVEQLLYSPWGFGTKVQEDGGLSPQIGPVHVLIVLMSLVLFRNKQVPVRVRIIGLVCAGVGLFLSCSISSYLWERVVFLTKFEFAWRMSGITSFAAALLSPLLYFHKKTQGALILGLIGVLILSFFFTVHPEYERSSDEYYQQYSHSTDFGAVTPKWTAGDPYSYPKTRIEVIGGEAVVSEFTRVGTRQQFTVEADTNAIILSNTLYYPGWEVFVDGRGVPIQFQDSRNRGLITFEIPPGKKDIVVQFRETNLRRLANMLSLFSFGFCFVLLLGAIMYRYSVLINMNCQAIVNRLNRQ